MEWFILDILRSAAFLGSVWFWCWGARRGARRCLSSSRFFPAFLGRGVLVLVLWRARGAGRCLRELWRAVRALLRALGRSAALNLSGVLNNRLDAFQP